MMKIDLLPDRADYYTQLKSIYDPVNSCQVHAAVQCLDIIGEVSKIAGPNLRPADNLWFLANNDPEILAFCKKSHGFNNPTVDNIVEWADVLVMTINKAVGYEAAYFSEYGLNDILLDLADLLPLMASLKWPERKISGHYVSIVGFDTNSDGGTSFFIIADPWKNTLKGTLDGFRNIYPVAVFDRHFKGYGIRFRRRS